MEISKTAVGCLVGVCVAAGAGTAYFATHDATPAVTSQQRTTAGNAEAAPEAAVEQSEVVLPEAPAVSPTPTSRRRAAAAPQPVSARQGPPPSIASEQSPRPAAPVESPSSVVPEQPVAAPPVEAPRITDNQTAAIVEPAGPQYEELVVAADSVIGLELESTLTSERARVEDQVVARVTRDVKVGDRVAIPAGSRAHGEVTLVERGSRLRDRARLGVRFTSVVLADGAQLPMRTETIYREGDAPGGESAAKIGGGAIGGAILGGILGGAKGAAIGGSVGAGAGSAAVLAGGRNPATLSAGSPITARIEEPVTVTVER
jgi:hypothetical protein